MFTETYQKIALKGCLRTAALAQFNLLGEALQSHRPEPREFDGGVTVKFGESTEPAVDTRGLDGSLKKPSLRKVSHQATKSPSHPPSHRVSEK